MSAPDYKSAQTRTVEINYIITYDLDYDEFKSCYGGDKDVEKVWFYMVENNSTIEFSDNDCLDSYQIGEAIEDAVNDAEDEVANETEADDEVLTFEGLNGFKLMMTVDMYKNHWNDYHGDDSHKATANGSCGTQFNIYYKPKSK